MISTTVPPSSHVRFSYFLPALLCIALFVVYGVVQNTFNSVRNKNEPLSAVNKNHFDGESNRVAQFKPLVKTPSVKVNATSELVNIKAEIITKATTKSSSSSNHTNKHEKLSAATKTENKENNKENATPVKERNKKDHGSNDSKQTKKSSPEDGTDNTTKTPCCEKETIENFQGAKASDKDLNAYSELLTKWASTLHDVRDAIKKGGTKAETAKTLLDSYIDGKISKNKYDDSLKKLEL